MIVGIPRHEFPAARDRLRPFLEDFARHNPDGVTAEMYELGVLQGQWQVWSINDFQAVCLTCLAPEAVRVHGCAGEARNEWQDALDDHLRDWAQALGKKRIVGLVRPGWARWAKTKGYRETHRELVLELE